jgi:2-polyprenyl-6-methoxyphenol hydroxylase-like FAD-dependent oxidoreductase
VLARCLDKGSTTTDALRRYQRMRSDRVAMVVRRSQRVGRVGQLENSLMCRFRDRVLAMIPPKVQLKQLGEIVGYEA